MDVQEAEYVLYCYLAQKMSTAVRAMALYICKDRNSYLTKKEIS
jgi:hypothetical protein